MEKFLKFRLINKVTKEIHNYDEVLAFEFGRDEVIFTDGNRIDLSLFTIDYAGRWKDKNDNDMFVGDIVKIPALRCTHEGQSNKNVWSKTDGFVEGLFLYGEIRQGRNLEISIYTPHFGKNKKIRDENCDPIGREFTSRNLYTHRTLYKNMEVIGNKHSDPEFLHLEGYDYEDHKREMNNE